MHKAAAVVVANGFDLSLSPSFEGGAPCHCYALSSQLWVKLLGLRPRLSALSDSVRQPPSSQNGLQLWACGRARLWLRLVQYEEKPTTYDHMPDLLPCIHPWLKEAVVVSSCFHHSGWTCTSISTRCNAVLHLNYIST